MGIRFIEEVEGISPGTNAYFMYGILKRFLAIQKQRRRFTFGLTKGIRDRKRLDRNAVIDSAESRSVDNFKKSRKEAERYELVEVNGIYKPVMATDGEMKL